VHKRIEPMPIVERPRTRPMEPAPEVRTDDHVEGAIVGRSPTSGPARPASDPPRIREPALAARSSGAILSGEVGEPRVLSNDTAVDGPRAASDPGGNGSEAPVSVMPTRAELEALFSEFVTAKKGRDESVSDLDLEAFAQTIQGECERLLQAHACKGVRFEVTEQDGEVSLRPRLIR